MNDELLIEYFDENNNDLDTYIVATELQEGWNRLLIKCGFSEIDECNFLVRLTNDRGEAIPGLKITTSAQNYVRHPGAPATVIENFAEAFFQHKIKENPQHLENYLLLADCYLRNDKAIEAELALREAIPLSPQSALLYDAILEAYLRGEKYDEQATTVEKLLTLDKNCPSALVDKISKHLENDDFDQAKEFIQRLAAVLPESETVYEQYIALYSKKEQIDKVIELNAKALKKYPANWDFVYLEAAIAMATTRKFDRAIELINDYLAEQQTTAALTNLADVYLQASDVGKWQESYQKARNVLVNKIGDCKDVATLCIAMLDAAGIKAHYVLVNTKNEGQNKNVLPSISFNHCLAGVETKTGVKYLDLTAYNYPFGQKEREKRLAESLGNDFPNVVLTRLDMENLDDLTPAVRYDYEFEAPNYISETGQFWLLKMCWTDAFGADQALSYDKRKYPYAITWADVDSVIEESQIALPAGYTPLDLPSSVKLSSAFADYAVHYSFAAGRLKAKRELLVKKTVVAPEEYAELKRFYNSIVKEDARQILLKKKP